MLNPISIMADRLGDYLSDLYLQYFSHRNPEYASYMGGAARRRGLLGLRSSTALDKVPEAKNAEAAKSPAFTNAQFRSEFSACMCQNPVLARLVQIRVAYGLLAMTAEFSRIWYDGLSTAKTYRPRTPQHEDGFRVAQPIPRLSGNGISVLGMHPRSFDVFGECAVAGAQLLDLARPRGSPWCGRGRRTGGRSRAATARSASWPGTSPPAAAAPPAAPAAPKACRTSGGCSGRPPCAGSRRS